MALKSAAPSGDKLGLAEVLGHLLVIAPTAYETGIVTQYTKPGDDPSDAIRVDVAVLTAQKEDGSFGPIYRDVLWFNVVRLSLRKSIPDTINGDVVLARVGQGPAKPGQDPQYILVDAMSDPKAVAFAEQWLAANPEFVTVAQTSAQRAAADAGTPAAVPAGQPVPGVGVNAGPVATAPTVAPVPTAATPTVGRTVVATPVSQIPTAPAPAAPAPAGGIDPALIGSLSPEERAQLLAALQA